MKKLEILEENVIKAFDNSDEKGKELLSNLFGKELFAMDIRDKIKTFQDAYALVPPCPNVIKWTTDYNGDNKDSLAVVAFAKLSIIAKALNFNDMSKVITFSRKFPIYHPRAGEPTYFVEKIYNSLFSKNNLMDYPKGMEIDESINDFKHHTIRAGYRWKVGDKFSPRVWSAKPYASPQITIAPDIEIVKIWNIGLRIRGDFKELYCEDCDLTHTSIETLAKNDGLFVNDLFSWFNKPFEGQIICWNDRVSY